MRDELSRVLTLRYPALYGVERCPFPFEHHDGWSGLLDALSEALLWNSDVEGREPPRARQVKEKMGTLRWYHARSDADNGAIELAMELSARTCERTGQRGRLGNRCGWWATRAPGVDGIEPGPSDVGGLPPMDLSLDGIRDMRSGVLAPSSALAIPAGWHDLVDALLLVFSSLSRSSSSGTRWHLARRDPDPVRVDGITDIGGGLLRIDYVGDGDYARGAVAAATALSRRIDPQTGHCSPAPGGVEA